ncbi:MAG: dTDP-4-dehydrorhamnose reductase [Flavobacteriaceae bacterium]
MKKILVTGGKGQLASSIKDVDQTLNAYEFIYVDVEELDITNKKAVDQFFTIHKFSFCINCAAYTAVDKAETDKTVAENVNINGAKYLAEACKAHGATMIQISTDFVFDGTQGRIYNEEDGVHPLGVYGETKLLGELAVSKVLGQHYILRTAWLYSEYGNNFVKTMIRLGTERELLNVVSDQIGTPTYAGDLAEVILKIITHGKVEYGTYHFSNEGVASWYDFTKAIFDLAAIDCKVLPIKSEAYPTPAKRPAFSVMDKSKLKNSLNIEIPYWRDSLKGCLNNFLTS